MLPPGDAQSNRVEPLNKFSSIYFSLIEANSNNKSTKKRCNWINKKKKDRLSRFKMPFSNYFKCEGTLCHCMLGSQFFQFRVTDESKTKLYNIFQTNISFSGCSLFLRSFIPWRRFSIHNPVCIISVCLRRCFFCFLDVYKEIVGVVHYDI